MRIRHTVKDDLNRMIEIYAKARDFMAATGNPNQWGPTNWPPVALLEEDIEVGRSYVCVDDDDNIIGTFCYIQGKNVDRTYDVIEDGAWTLDQTYGAVHRLASDGPKGVGAFCLRWAFGQCGYLRVDTHTDNVVMQHILEREGFKKCGIIYVEEDDYPRYAYEKMDIGNVMKLEHHVLSNGAEIPLFTFPSLDATGFVKNAFTTRLGGVSEGIFSTLNLNFHRGDSYENVFENFRRAAEAMGVDHEKMVLSYQTHTTNIRVVTEADAGKGIMRPKDFADIDGLITNVPGLTLATFFADCVPLYFVDPVKKAIGLSHSGWKGTVARMGKATIKAMHETFGSDPADLICAIGPSICQDCYEVSEDVATAFKAEFPEHVDELLIDKHNGHYQLNLWAANRIIMEEAGVKPENISVTDVCTCCNPDLLYSHRASHGKRGNLAAFMCIKED